MQAESIETFQTLNDIAEAHGGYLQASEAAAHDIDEYLFRQFVDSQGYEQVACGIYLASDAMDDDYYLLQLQHPHIVFSHHSALFIHTLSDTVPVSPAVTVQRGHSTDALESAGARVFAVRESLHEVGLSYKKTFFGNTIRVYDLERTVCDLLRNKDCFEAQDYCEPLKYYTLRPDKDLYRLDDYARQFGVQEKAREYMRLLKL